MSRIILVNTRPTRVASTIELDHRVRRYFEALEARGPKLGDTRTEPNNGLLVLGGCLDAAGHDVTYLDLSAIEHRWSGVAGRFPSREELFEFVTPFAANADFLFFSSTLVGLSDALWTIERCKEMSPQTVTVLGGSAASLVPRLCIAHGEGLDVLVRGEGEKAALEIVEAYELGRPDRLAGRRGVSFRVNRRESIELQPGLDTVDLDELGPLGFPKWSLLDPELGPHAYRLMSARGCGFRCTYCVPSALCGHRVRPHREELVLEALESLAIEVDPPNWVLGDLTFFWDEAHGRRVLEGIIARGLERPFWCQTHLSRVSSTNLDLLHRAGCVQLAVGVESLDQPTIEAVGKEIDPATVEEALHRIKGHGIETQVYFMVGFPEDDSGTIARNREFICRGVATGLIDRTHIGVYVPYPGLEARGSAELDINGLHWFTQGVFPDLPSCARLPARDLDREEIDEAFASCLGAVARAYEGRGRSA